jgi:hypothetical protein
LTYPAPANKLQLHANRNQTNVLDRSSHKLFLRLRIVAAFVLASLAWGSTAEFTHNHGVNAAKRVAPAQTVKSPTAAADLANESAVQTTEDERSSSRSTSRSECLICQLHHNLSTTLISEPPSVDANLTSALRPSFAVVLQHSEYTANQYGRAPPTIL